MESERAPGRSRIVGRAEPVHVSARGDSYVFT